MKQHLYLNQQLDTAWDLKQCLRPSTRALEAALNRRVQSGEIIRVFPRTYARTEQWNMLDPIEQDRYLIRAVSASKPSLIFGGREAAVIHGFEHQYQLHRGQRKLTIVESPNGSHPQKSRFTRIYHSSIPVMQVDGIQVTTPAQTVVDCAIMYPFVYALAIADSALRAGVSVTQIIEAAAAGKNPAQAMRVLHYADSRSENGGESYARAVIIESGFMVPELQVNFIDPQTQYTSRVDFLWRLPNGMLIAGELDGREKYVNPTMTKGRSINGIVVDEQERMQGLIRAGVSRIMRFGIADCDARTPLIRKLTQYGIPRVNALAS